MVGKLNYHDLQNALAFVDRIKQKTTFFMFSLPAIEFIYSCGLSTETIEYSSACVCVCVCLCVCKHDNSKKINLGT